jgi:hypothetical protein
VSDARDENPYQVVGEKKSSSSCCVYGCLITFLLVAFVVVGGGLAGYWWVQGQVNRFTADAPADLPVVELSDDELAEIQARVDNFKETIEAGETPEDLVLTAEEINALISKDEDLRGKVYVAIDDGQVTGDVSIPTDFLPGGKGRYFNASATFDVSLENGVLIVTLNDAEVKGEKLPQQFIEAMSKENLAKDAYKDPEVASTLRRIESISIEGDKIVLKPRVTAEKAAQEGAATDSGEAASGEVVEPTKTTEPSQPEGVDKTSTGEGDSTAEPE